LCGAGRCVGGCVGCGRGDCVHAGSFRGFDRLGWLYRFEFRRFVVVVDGIVAGGDAQGLLDRQFPE
jgi:hypothetical protein